jgi:hypothetical protein
MENQENSPQSPQAPLQQALPNSTGVLVLGIVSIATCWCWGIIGLAAGIIALVLASKSKKLYDESPDSYTESSYKNMNAGRICAIIGTILSALYLIFIIVYFVILGAAVGGIFSMMPWEAF